eukprot:SAG31_NODE_23525_length_502_cov_1.121588_2_plen_41_part_01
MSDRFLAKTIMPGMPGHSRDLASERGGLRRTQLCLPIWMVW